MILNQSYAMHYCPIAMQGSSNLFSNQINKVPSLTYIVSWWVWYFSHSLDCGKLLTHLLLPLSPTLHSPSHHPPLLSLTLSPSLHSSHPPSTPLTLPPLLSPTLHSPSHPLSTPPLTHPPLPLSPILQRFRSHTCCNIIQCTVVGWEYSK